MHAGYYIVTFFASLASIGVADLLHYGYNATIIKDVLWCLLVVLVANVWNQLMGGEK